MKTLLLTLVLIPTIASAEFCDFGSGHFGQACIDAIQDNVKENPVVIPEPPMKIWPTNETISPAPKVTTIDTLERRVKRLEKSVKRLSKRGGK